MAFRDGKLNRNTLATEAHANLIPKYNRYMGTRSTHYISTQVRLRARG